MSWLVLVAIMLQIVLGAFVAGLKSGFSYNTWPLMQGEFFPSHVSGSLEMHTIFNISVMVQFTHRWFAFVALAGVAVLWYKARQADLGIATNGILNLLFLTGIAQITLGIATLVLAVPISLGVLHQSIAMILFGLVVLAMHQVRQGELPRPLRDRAKTFQRVTA